MSYDESKGCVVLLIIIAVCWVGLSSCIQSSKTGSMGGTTWESDAGYWSFDDDGTGVIFGESGRDNEIKFKYSVHQGTINIDVGDDDDTSGYTEDYANTHWEAELAGNKLNDEDDRLEVYSNNKSLGDRNAYVLTRNDDLYGPDDIHNDDDDDDEILNPYID